MPIILFIDEAHTMIGAGGQAGQNDAANLLKPALARGELRTIAATTWSEYKKYFEKDAALARRFQVVKVEEPSETLASVMLRGMAALMEKHHQRSHSGRCDHRSGAAVASLHQRPSIAGQGDQRARHRLRASRARRRARHLPRSTTRRNGSNASTPKSPRWSAKWRVARCTTSGSRNCAACAKKT